MATAKASAIDAAFYGFGLVTRAPLTFLGVAIVMSALGVYMGVTVLPVEARIMELYGAALSSPDSTGALAASSAEINALSGSIWPVYLVCLGLIALVYPALYRPLVQSPSRGWLLGFKIGLDEVRVLLVTLIGYIISMLPYLASAVVGVIAFGVTIGVMMGSAAAAGADASTPPAGAMMAAGGVLCVAVLVGLLLWAWLGIKLSLAGPASVGEKRFVVFQSWSMTRGRAWTLFWAYVLLFLLFAVLYAVVVFAASAAGVTLAALQQVALGPAVVIGGVIYGVVTTFLSAAFLGVASRVYLDWKAQASVRVEPT